MFQKIKHKALHVGLLVAIGGSLVQLINQVQLALDIIDRETEPEPRPLYMSDPTLAEMELGEREIVARTNYNAGYAAGWVSGRHGDAEQPDVPLFPPDQEGNTDE